MADDDVPLTFGPFVTAMYEFVPEYARILHCQFRGDPLDDIPGKWRARVLNPDRLDQIDAHANVYVCVSAMQKNERGEFRRRKENFAGGLLLMIDDIGSGPGAKFPLSLVKPLPPSALIETSPDNFQAIYLFDRLVTDIAEMDALIRAFIARQFLSADTGMAGVNRVFRPPIGVNGKAKYYRDGKPWVVRAAELNLDRRYSVAQIAAAFDLTLVQQVRATPPPLTGALGLVKAERIRLFIALHDSLEAADMIKAQPANYDGWTPIVCPWIDEHSGAANTGTGLREPAPENEWWGAFVCHHGHCRHRGIRELSDWISEQQAWVLDAINAEAQS